MRLIVCLIVCCSVLLSWAGNASRPNIVFILADDQRWDALGCAGHPVLKTPNIDQLAEEGTFFSQARVTTSICMVSRASILTGQYARRHGVNDFFATLSEGQMALTYPVLMRDSGYYTGFIGKWGIGDTVDATNLATNYFDFWAGVSHQGNYWHERTCAYVRGNGVCDCPPDGRGTAGPKVRFGKGSIKDPVHFTTEIIPKKFSRFLKTRDPDKPFCVSVSLKSPHNPYDYDSKFAPFFKGLEMPVRANATPEAAAKMGHARSSLAGKQGLNYANNSGLHGPLQETMRDYCRMLAGADEAVGQMLQALTDAGVDENTVVVYTADNGYMLGEHGLFGKWLPYEESIRVPMILRDPRVKNRSNCSATVLNIDVAPTLLELSGLPVPDRMQGKSLLPLLQEGAKDSSFRKEWFYEHLFDAGGQIETTEAMIRGPWKYIRYLRHEDAACEELYNLNQDVLELNNLREDPESRQQLNALRERYREMRSEIR